MDGMHTHQYIIVAGLAFFVPIWLSNISCNHTSSIGIDNDGPGIPEMYTLITSNNNISAFGSTVIFIVMLQPSECERERETRSTTGLKREVMRYIYIYIMPPFWGLHTIYPCNKAHDVYRNKRCIHRHLRVLQPGEGGAEDWIHYFSGREAESKKVSGRVLC